MAEPRFFPLPAPLSISEILTLTGARLANGVGPASKIGGVAPLGSAGPDEATFVESAAYSADLAKTRAAACFCPPKLTGDVPAGTAALETRDPARAFALLTATLYPDALKGPVGWVHEGVSPAAAIDPEALLEEGVTVEPLAVVAKGAAIGRGTRIGAGSVVGPSVQIGRGCTIGPSVSISHALIGDGVVVHGGARIGQDGFGYSPGSAGHQKVPQIGRVIIQNQVEIGANTTIDRGSIRDTVIGEGTKIDNLCQIAHNVVIGRHCLIAGQVGISGSVTIGDFVMLGGNVGIAPHATIGSGASVAAKSGVAHDIPAGQKWAGYPAIPGRDWLRLQGTIGRLMRRAKATTAGSGKETS